MKRFGLGILSILVLFGSCISEEENFSLRLEQDKDAILAYLSENQMPSAKEFKDEVQGVYIFWENVMTTEYEIQIGDTLLIDYTGKLLNNTIFDTTNDSIATANNIRNPQRAYEPYPYIVGRDRFIQGFEFALSKMQEGDKVITLFPSFYGYGTTPQGNIPANSPLIFEIDLVQIKKATAND